MLRHSSTAERVYTIYAMAGSKGVPYPVEDILCKYAQMSNIYILPSGDFVAIPIEVLGDKLPSPPSHSPNPRLYPFRLYCPTKGRKLYNSLVEMQAAERLGAAQKKLKTSAASFLPVTLRSTDPCDRPRKIPDSVRWPAQGSTMPMTNDNSYPSTVNAPIVLGQPEAAPVEMSASSIDGPVSSRTRNASRNLLPVRDIHPEPLLENSVVAFAPANNIYSRHMALRPPAKKLMYRDGPDNRFALRRRYYAKSLPKHDPEEHLELQDLYDLKYHTNDVVKRSPLGPFPNLSSFELGEWYINMGSQLSVRGLQELVDLMQSPGFSEDVAQANWPTIFHRLGANKEELTQHEDAGEEWIDDDGWNKSPIVMPVPVKGITEDRVVGTLYHRNIVSIIREKIERGPDAHLFHYEPFELLWQPDPTTPPSRVHSELYNSDAFLKAHRDLQDSPKPVDCNRPRVVVGLMFWSDATHVTSFSDHKLWPCYMGFANESKYRRGKPTSELLHHIAYFDSLSGTFKDYVIKRGDGRLPPDPFMSHCKNEMMHSQWRIMLDEELLDAILNGLVIKCQDGIERRFYIRIFTYSADYPERLLPAGRVMIATIRQRGDCPCTRCLIKMTEADQMGTPEDMLRREKTARKDDDSRRALVKQARAMIIPEDQTKGVAIDKRSCRGAAQATVTEPCADADSNFDIFSTLTVDLLHEFEIGVWKGLFIHILRIVDACGPAGVLLHEYRLVPNFGNSIRRFSSSVSKMTRKTARDFEDLLQCALPVFDGLFPDPLIQQSVIAIIALSTSWRDYARKQKAAEAAAKKAVAAAKKAEADAKKAHAKAEAEARKVEENAKKAKERAEADARKAQEQAEADAKQAQAKAKADAKRAQAKAAADARKAQAQAKRAQAQAAKEAATAIRRSTQARKGSNLVTTRPTTRSSTRKALEEAPAAESTGEETSNNGRGKSEVDNLDTRGENINTPPPPFEGELALGMQSGPEPSSSNEEAASDIASCGALPKHAAGALFCMTTHSDSDRPSAYDDPEDLEALSGQGSGETGGSVASAGSIEEPVPLASASPDEAHDQRLNSKTSKRKAIKIAIGTPKFHFLGDYVKTIRTFGTTDNYSTELGELHHRSPKRWYRRSSKRNFRPEVLRHERKVVRMRKLRQRLESLRKACTKEIEEQKAAARMADIHHYIAQDQNAAVPLTRFTLDPECTEGEAMSDSQHDPLGKIFVPQLLEHILPRVISHAIQKQKERLAQEGSDFPEGRNATVFDSTYLSFRGNRIYSHKIMRLKYTTYDVRRREDVLHVDSDVCNVMLPNPSFIHSPNEPPYLYARLLGIYHGNVAYMGEIAPGVRYLTHSRFEFLWVRWYSPSTSENGMPLECITLQPLDSPDATSFIDPHTVLRAAHIIPRFHSKKVYPTDHGTSEMGRDRFDWNQYYVNRYADRDMLMRFHIGMGVGHIGVWPNPLKRSVLSLSQTMMVPTGSVGNTVALSHPAALSASSTMEVVGGNSDLIADLDCDPRQGMDEADDEDEEYQLDSDMEVDEVAVADYDHRLIGGSVCHVECWRDAGGVPRAEAGGHHFPDVIAPIPFVAQVFFATRIWILTKRVVRRTRFAIIPVVSCEDSASNVVSNFVASSSHSLSFNSLPEPLLECLRIAVVYIEASSATVAEMTADDYWLTLSFPKVGFASSSSEAFIIDPPVLRVDSIVDRIVIYAINRAAATSLCAILSVLTYFLLSGTYYFIVPTLMTGQLYVISVVSVLTSRESLRDELAPTDHRSDEEGASVTRLGEKVVSYQCATPGSSGAHVCRRLHVLGFPNSTPDDADPEVFAITPPFSSRPPPCSSLPCPCLLVYGRTESTESEFAIVPSVVTLAQLSTGSAFTKFRLLSGFRALSGGGDEVIDSRWPSVVVLVLHTIFEWRIRVFGQRADPGWRIRLFNTWCIAQCGGQGWTGATSCVSGYTCTKANDWYSQCLPGAAAPTSATQTTPTQPSTPTSTVPSAPQPTSGGKDLPFGTLVTGCTVPNTIAITFDDGPYTWTSGLIDSLNSANVSATFFVVGSMYGCIYNYADVIKKYALRNGLADTFVRC
ncbi:hypothetical protein NMY22_g8114 [Coprinellus aureogranulatus]|nr:hypothetical protein NMY22_g8114 [Coprinellus aureogranulatus]